MKKNHMLLWCCLVFAFMGKAQVAYKLQAVAKKFSAVKDFSAVVKIDFDLPSIKLEPMSGNVFFRSPDRYKVKLDGVAFLPKQNPFAFLSLLRDSTTYVAVANGIENYSGAVCERIQVVPVNDPEIVLAKVWIDVRKQLLMKTEITGRSNGTVVAEYKYGKQSGFALPDQLRFTVDMKTFSLPKMISVDINSKKKQTEPGKMGKGKIDFLFSGYLINKGVTDAQLK
jgi:hypothetical protein